MIHRAPLLSLALAALLAGAAGALLSQSPAPAPAGVPAEVPDAELARARQAADALVARLREVLAAALEKQGPAGAVDVCAERAQAETGAAAAELGLSVRRVSLRHRNPADAPDAYERATLERLEAEMKTKGLPAEVAEVVTPAAGGAPELRYLRPVVVAPHCLACHGQPNELAPGVAEILARRFPGDTATGYAAGDLRGAVSVRVPLGPG